jgi:hypothetical protein
MTKFMQAETKYILILQQGVEGEYICGPIIKTKEAKGRLRNLHCSSAKRRPLVSRHNRNELKIGTQYRLSD